MRRRHSDLELLESEKQAAKQRITMAVSGNTITNQPVYTKTKKKEPKNKMRKWTVEDFEFVPAPTKSRPEKEMRTKLRRETEEQSSRRSSRSSQKSSQRSSKIRPG